MRLVSLLPFLDSATTLPRPVSCERAGPAREAWLAAAGRLDERDAAFAEALASDTRAASFLDGIFDNSPHLSDALRREPGLLRMAAEHGLDAAFESTIDEISSGACWQKSWNETGALLRAAKRRAALTVALADLSGAWPLENVMAALSRLAEAVLASALRHVLRAAAARGVLDVVDGDAPDLECGLTVLAMGKLGASELNYSSDIDFIVLFDREKVRHRGKSDATEDLHRLVRDLIALLSERTSEGYVYRTDLRLRPDTGTAPLALSTAAAEQYYETLGQNWERAAMIKARAVGGDAAVGAQILERLSPFIWRKYLDFAAIQDIQSIKRQINTHRGHHLIAVAGHNIKLGRGGIREVEFYAQTQQLIWGGRDASLRVRGTCEALRALAAAGHASRDAADALTASYVFLRRLENRLQMIADQQTHTLPEDEEGLTAIAALSGFADMESFEGTVRRQLECVETHYAELFEDQPELVGEGGNLVFTGTEDDPDTLATLSSLGFGDDVAVSAVVRGWHHGRIRATRSTRARELLTELMPTLLRELGKTANPDAAFRKFDEFLGRLPSGVQLFSLFHANPGLLARVAEIMGSAPRLAEHLSRRPSLLEGLLTGDSHRPMPERTMLLAELERTLDDQADFQDALDAVRRWQHEREFRIGMQLLRGDAPKEHWAGGLSDLADVAVNALLPRVERAFARTHGVVPGGAFAVLGMGKLGGREMTFESDLDVIFLYASPKGITAMSDGPRPLAASQYYARFGQRLASALSALTPEGGLYRIDTRLRPSGGSGPFASETEAFFHYQQENAWTWEHMALTRARPVAGDAALRARVAEGVHAILTEPRDGDALLADVAAMRERVDGERRTTNHWRLKHIRGGLLDLEFIAQYHLLRHGARHPEILVPSTEAMFRRLGDAGVLDADEARELADITAFLQRLQSVLRLTLGTGREAEKFSAGVRETLVRAMGLADFAALETRLFAMQDTVRRAYARLIAEPAGTDRATCEENA